MNYSDNIKVVNLRHSRIETGWIDIRCDRSSVLGNPFELQGEKNRVAVVYAHKQWLNQCRLNAGVDKPIPLDVWGIKIASAFKHPTSSQVMQELDRIECLLRAGKKVRLQCWCKPASCHCDNYKAYLIWRLS